MKILLDTNIVIHRESNAPINKEIGKIFKWIDNLGYKKYINKITVEEITRLQNANTLNAFKIKLENYNILPTIPDIHPIIKNISEKLDVTKNDQNDTKLLNEVLHNRVDLLLTEDRKIHKKASLSGIEERVFTLDSFLEKIISENPKLVTYKVLSVKKEYFGNINLNEPFWDSFKEDYIGFEKWFNHKSDEQAYVCFSNNKLVAFLYLKIENENEPYNDITPPFKNKKRVKIGTFKVIANGYKLGERFLKIIFDNSLALKVEEIYVTIFPKRHEQKRLIYLLQDFGFTLHGIKKSKSGSEEVYVRSFKKHASISSPKSTFPFVSDKTRKFIVPIYPEYHTNLFPDSILNTESPNNFVENEPFRNSISKVYISRSHERNLKTGDLVVFYRTGGYYKGVISTLSIVESIYTRITDFNHFVNLCRKRSVFSDAELLKHWNFNPNSHPFVVNILYVYSFPKRLNLKRLIELGIIKSVDSVPRGFERINNTSFLKIIKESKTNENFIIN